MKIANFVHAHYSTNYVAVRDLARDGKTLRQMHGKSLLNSEIKRKDAFI